MVKLIVCRIFIKCRKTVAGFTQQTLIKVGEVLTHEKNMEKTAVMGLGVGVAAKLFHRRPGGSRYVFVCAHR